jgi:hypothetical protein
VSAKFIFLSSFCSPLSEIKLIDVHHCEDLRRAEYHAVAFHLKLVEFPSA